jgi:hypothetical protein
MLHEERLRPDRARLRHQACTDEANAALASGREFLRWQAAKNEAGLTIEQAAIARLYMNYNDAAKLYVEAADLLSSFDSALRWRCIILAALCIGEDRDNYCGDSIEKVAAEGGIDDIWAARNKVANLPSEASIISGAGLWERERRLGRAVTRVEEVRHEIEIEGMRAGR